MDTVDWRHMHRFGKKALPGLGKHTWLVFGMHCDLEKQFGVKFWMTINQLFGSLDFVWEPTIVASFGGKFQFGLLISSCCYWFYIFDFGCLWKIAFVFLKLAEIDRLELT